MTMCARIQKPRGLPVQIPAGGTDSTPASERSSFEDTVSGLSFNRVRTRPAGAPMLAGQWSSRSIANLHLQRSDDDPKMRVAPGQA